MRPMSDANSEPRDVAASAVRALVLYSLAEFQSGNATTIRVNADGLTFEVSDDGRGHAIDRTIGGLPYMSFVYTHLDYPFASSDAPPIQLHTIGLSFINTLCSQLEVTVHQHGTAFRTTYRNGQLSGERAVASASSGSGNVIAGALNPQLQPTGINAQSLQRWLASLVAANPSLRLFFNSSLVGCSSHAGDV
jgi:DNA gyrase/topoisomerase IV subunit B